MDVAFLSPERLRYARTDSTKTHEVPLATPHAHRIHPGASHGPARTAGIAAPVRPGRRPYQRGPRRRGGASLAHPRGPRHSRLAVAAGGGLAGPPRPQASGPTEGASAPGGGTGGDARST